MPLTSRACLSFRNSSIQALGANRGESISAQIAAVLEIFVHHRELEDAYNAYCRRQDVIDGIDATAVTHEDPNNRLEAAVLAGNRIVICIHKSMDRAFQLLNYLNINGLHSAMDFATTLRQWALEDSGIVDVTQQSWRSLSVILNLASAHGIASGTCKPVSFSEFCCIAESLRNAGLLTLPIGSIDFGDFLKNAPFCHDYGFTRGTPIDRYYLRQFVASVRHEVTGETLEIGGRKENRQEYAFFLSTSYRVMDIDQNGDADVVADVHDPNAWKEESLDSVVIFNVLEHCERPWIVVENVRRWLRKGGRVFCAVPNAQRIHPGPGDFWRILPDALSSLFQNYNILKCGTYGNLLTTTAALSGAAAEEVLAEELARWSPHYPVMSWIVAQKM